ncbi:MULTISPECIES: type IV toxin-antitoxin system YeeU family antitoxin [Aeromonas]|uniref:type IV toxin-antitoxin system YeeU family antitoxin n=2 Tax=Aeromonas TaxID=642 RepID=UPI00311CC401
MPDSAPRAPDQTTPAPQRARHHHPHPPEVPLIMTTTHPTCSATQQPEAPALTPFPSISWGLPRDISPRFGARLIQSRYRLDFLSDRASLIGDWSEVQIAKLDLAFPEIIKALEAKLLTGELDAQRQHCITIQHGGFTCEADTLGSHGYVYVALYPTITL